uniref:Uncharacterized protein n=1 Tax=Alexandrium monilatum TaxID=311494 RepID=A0A7S4VTR2_9DINO
MRPAGGAQRRHRAAKLGRWPWASFERRHRRMLRGFAETPSRTVDEALHGVARGVNARGVGCCPRHILYLKLFAHLCGLIKRPCDKGLRPFDYFQCQSCLTMNVEPPDPEFLLCQVCLAFHQDAGAAEGEEWNWAVTGPVAGGEELQGGWDEQQQERSAAGASAGGKELEGDWEEQQQEPAAAGAAAGGEDAAAGGWQADSEAAEAARGWQADDEASEAASPGADQEAATSEGSLAYKHTIDAADSGVDATRSPVEREGSATEAPRAGGEAAEAAGSDDDPGVISGSEDE